MSAEVQGRTLVAAGGHALPDADCMGVIGNAYTAMA
jgi:hypothetical protein